MSDIGIIGSVDVVNIFNILGLDVYPAENANEAKGHLSKIIDEEKNKIVFIMESLASHMGDELLRTEEVDSITVVPLPDHRGEISYIDDALKRLSRAAVGMEV